MTIEIVWKKGSDSGGNDGGDCFWVAEVAPLREQLGDATLKIDDEIILDTTDVVVRDEYDNLCQYTYREFSVFGVAVKAGEFDELIAKGAVVEEKVVRKPPTQVSIIHVPTEADGVTRRSVVNLGYIEIDTDGNITGKITQPQLREGLKTEDIYFDVLESVLLFKPTFGGMTDD